MNRFTHSLAALPLLAALHGQTVAAEQAEMVYRPGEGEAAPQVVAQGCPVNIVSVTDGRNNRETIGLYRYRESLLAGDMLPWVGGALERLKASGFQLMRESAPRARAVNIDVRLTRAYTFSWSPYRGGMVAMEVGIDGAAAPVKLRRMAFKGEGNWDGPNAHVALLNRVADQVVDSLAEALLPACAGLAGH